jgi:hypothetical protein
MYIAACCIAAAGLAACSNRETPEPVDPTAPPDVKIAASSTTIKANGTDSVYFTVTLDGVDVTSATTVVRKDDPVETLDRAGFATRVPGTYTFYASHEGTRSDEVTVEATAVVLKVEADRADFRANGREKVYFTVTADGEDVTAGAQIFLAGEPEEAQLIDGAFFRTKKAGTYTFSALYEGSRSEAISVEALAVVLALRADRESFRADENERVSFTVTADGEDVTAQAAIFRKTAGGDEALAGTDFSTDEPGRHEFRAVFEGDTAQTVAVEAIYVAIPFLRQYLIMQFSGTSCPNCPLMTDAILSVQAELSQRMIHHICLHLYGKHCYSSLAGAIAEVSNGLSSDTRFPSVLVDLRDEVGLFPTLTPRELKRALDRSGTGAAATGIAIASQVEGTRIDFTVSVRTTRADGYRFYAFIVEDGIRAPQSTHDGSGANYIHNSVGTYVIPDADPRTGIALAAIRPGEEARHAFSIETKDISAGRAVNLSRCRIVVYTLKPSGDGYVIDNVAACPVNGAAGYVYKR